MSGLSRRVFRVRAVRERPVGVSLLLRRKVNLLGLDESPRDAEHHGDAVGVHHAQRGCDRRWIVAWKPSTVRIRPSVRERRSIDRRSHRRRVHDTHVQKAHQK